MSNPIKFYNLKKPYRKKFTKKTKLTPSRYLKDRFVPISKSITPSIPITNKINLSPQSITSAGFSIGYAIPKVTPGGFTHWAPTNQRRILSFLKMSTRRIFPMLQYTAGKAETSSIYEELEESDKNSISFFLGSIVTSLTAKLWINLHGQRLDLLIHERIFTKAMTPSPKSNKKHADFIALTKSNEMHVFESKGGKDIAKPIFDGLSQLEAMKSVLGKGVKLSNGRKLSSTVTPSSYVCVHSFIKSKKTIQVRAYDPPGEKSSTTNEEPIFIDLNYVKLVKILRSIDIFWFFNKQDISKIELNSDENWHITKSDISDSENSRIAIPCLFLENELTIRSFLMFYDYTKEITDDKKKNKDATAKLIKDFRKQTAEFIAPTIFDKWHSLHDKKASTIVSILEKATKDVISILRAIDDNPYKYIAPFDKPKAWDFILDIDGMIPANEDQRILHLGSGI